MNKIYCTFDDFDVYKREYMECYSPLPRFIVKKSIKRYLQEEVGKI